MMRKLMTTVAVMAAMVVSAGLKESFKNPPRDAKPHTWWHWMNGNVTKEGITADLEAMHEIGIGGAQIFDAGCNIPAGPLAFNTPEWFDTIKHAAAEARRLGIELCLPNCSGWSSSGGPWITPEMGMKSLFWTTRKVKGPAVFDDVVAEPPNKHGFYADIAVFAVPASAAEADSPEAAGVKETTAADGARLFTFPKPYTANGFDVRLNLQGWEWLGEGTVTVEASADGEAFREVCKRTLTIAQSGRNSPEKRYIYFDGPVTAKAFRFRFDYPKQFKLTFEELMPRRAARVASFALKNFGIRMQTDQETPAIGGEVAVAKEAVVELTAKMAKDGRLRWEVPAGEWTIVRLGYAATGQRNHPASYKGEGLEVDKLSAEAMDFHFEQYVAKLCRHLGGLAGAVETGLNNILVDSYEVGSQNWTQKMEEEFARRAGYSMRPYFPALVGFIVGSVEESERFLWDFRRVVADMFAENYAGALAKKCHEYGLKLSLEPYGNGPTDNLQYGQNVDIPMGEFWNALSPQTKGVGNARFPAYLAHVWGRRYIGMESFTGGPWAGTSWKKDPYGLKAQGDRVYAAGVNRIIYHRFVHQPWPDGKYVPGMTMGMYGMHFDRTQTWWKHGGPEWIAYQTRCQHLLQEGTVVADALFFCGENVPNAGGSYDGTPGKVPKLMPDGYSWDIATREAIRACRVEDGRIVVPGGVRYRLLVLPESDTMTPGMLKEIARLVAAGAKVAAPVKPVRSYGLAGWPGADAETARLADELWAKPGLLAMTAADALKALGIEPDFTASDAEARYIHRDYGAEGEGYFVAVPNAAAETVECSFRVRGKVPELWDAEDGSVRRAPVWREEGGRTVVTLRFEPSGSVFVMFREPSGGVRAEGDAAALVEQPAATVPVEGAWEIWFPAGWSAPESVTAKRLKSWTEFAETGIKYFSGTATYVKRVEFGRTPAAGERVVLDLGDVRNIAEVTANGVKLPTRWKPPFRVDVTDALARGNGRLELEVKVTNLWVNRLIGDDIEFAEDCEWTKGEFREKIVRIPDWVKAGKPSPTGRHTFTTWKHWNKHDPLMPSGLLGPVRLESFPRR